LGANAGPFTGRPNITNEDVGFLDIFYLAEQLYWLYYDSTNQTDFVNENFSMFLAFAKPKAEVYTQAQYKTKTRNIFSLSSPTMVFAQIV